MLRNYRIFALSLLLFSLCNVFGSSDAENGAVLKKYFRYKAILSSMIANDKFLMTPEGIDPNDPEEINRIKDYLEHIDIYQINKNFNKTDDLFEGDIKKHVFRNAGNVRRWPKTKFGRHRGLVRIPYTISKEYSIAERQVILSAMETYENYTCIRFVPRTSQRAYINILDQKRCWSYVGYSNIPKQPVSLGIPNCVYKGIALHELMHVVGFLHEQSRSDRDKYVRVIGENMDKGWDPNYNKDEESKNLVVYDYGSVMHYKKTDGSRKAYLPAMEAYPERDPEPLFGQRRRLSPYDIEEIKYLYNCEHGTFPRCGRDFINLKKGSFSSPAYPRAYPAEAHCTWKITVARVRFVEVTFTNVNIEESPLCQNDAILIHDGRNAGAPVLERICGRRSSVVITGTQHELFTIFSSDISRNTYTGFRAAFKEVATAGTPSPGLQIVSPTLPPVQQAIDNFSCNFDEDLCNMTQDTSDVLDFLPNRGETPTARTGPDSDHTSGNGRYLFVEGSSPSRNGDTARIRTPWINRKDQFCISFSYHMYGQYMGGIRVYAFEKRTNNNAGTAYTLWEKFDNQGNKWHVATITYRPRKNVEYFQIYVEGFIFTYLSDLAIDDLSVLPTFCHTVRAPSHTASTAEPTTTPLVGRIRQTFKCNFEPGYCGMKQSSDDTFNWGRRRGRTPTQGTGPVNDHSSGIGYYTYVESSTPRKEGDVAMLETPALSPSPHCLVLWYNMNGRTMGSLNIIQEVDGARTVLKKIEGHKGQPWAKLSETITPGKQNARYIKILLEANIGNGVFSDMAVDDIEISNRQCAQDVIVPPSSLPDRFICNFENNMCGFQQLHDDNFDWTRHRGETPSDGTGPNSDHTLKTSEGYFIYLESSNPQRQFDVAKLLTPKLKPGSYCVRFAYQMHGTSVGNLEVMSLEAPSATLTSEWREDNNQGKQWLTASFDFTSSSNTRPVQFIFQGQIGTGFSSDIGLDDIRIEPGTCSGAGTFIPPTAPTDTSRTKQRPAPSSNAQPAWAGMPLCTFDIPTNSSSKISTSEIPADSTNDLGKYIYPTTHLQSALCGLTQFRKYDDFDWTRNNGATLSVNTGPTRDRSSVGGHYMFIEASGRKRDDKAFLQSYFMPASDYCLDFYYHMYGESMGSIVIKIIEILIGGSRKRTILRRLEGNQGNSWRNVKVDFSPVENGVNVAFRLEGVVGSSSKSDAAFDDFAVMPGRCDACQNPSYRYNVNGQVQEFASGCIHTGLFYVRCCSSSQPKAVYRRVRNCNGNMFSAARLNWYCQNL